MSWQVKLSSPWSAAKAERRKARRQERRSKFIALLGGKCQNCGSTDGLQFDHIDPETKTLTIADNIDLSDLNLLDEVGKCQLLCRKCHHKKTLDLNQYSIRH